MDDNKDNDELIKLRKSNTECKNEILSLKNEIMKTHKNYKREMEQIKIKYEEQLVGSETNNNKLKNEILLLKNQVKQIQIKYKERNNEITKIHILPLTFNTHDLHPILLCLPSLIKYSILSCLLLKTVIVPEYPDS